MIGLWKSLSGMYDVELTTAAPEARLREINEWEIPIFQVRFVSELCVRFRIRRKDRGRLVQLCKSRGDELVVRRQLGIYRLLPASGQRPVLLAGIGILIFATLILPTRVLFVKVEGNQMIAKNRILEAAEQCGICFGAERKEIRSEQVKNGLLVRIPELKWAGVNTYGCVAVISVREAVEEEKEISQYAVSNVVALRDGVILECTATKGTLLCKPGEVVQEGQILISGYTDCGRIIQATNAQGEVFAQTLRVVRMSKLQQGMVRGEKCNEQKRISIIVGKKRINLWKDSGIWDATCDRMYQEYYLTMPGGYRLPVALCIETNTRYELTEINLSDSDVSAQLESYAEEYLLQQMNAGQIRTSSIQTLQENGVSILEGNYICTEMIGRVQPEQIGEKDGKTD